MTKIYGTHIIQELYDAPFDKLNDDTYMINTLVEQAKQQNATIIDTHWHRFEPYGISQIVILAESHISIHTWPEDKYQSLDIYTCGEHVMPHKALQYILDNIKCKAKVKTLARGI